MKALVIGSGNLNDPELIKMRYEWADFVIAADGGAQHLVSVGLKPHVLLGDFDSLPEATLASVKNSEDVEIFPFPVEKDYTDMELALDLAVQRGANEIAIMGATGTRLDHTSANIFLLYGLLEKGIKCFIEDSNNRIHLINESITLKRQQSRKVSLLAVSPNAEGISTKGLSYPLSDATLKFGSSLGISNEFIADEASVSIKNGLLLVFESKD